MPPGVLWGDSCLAYAHSQMNPQTWTKVQPFDSLPWLLNVWPPKTPENAPLCLVGQFVWCISIPRWICTCVPNLVPIGPAVSHLPLAFACVTPNPPSPNVEGQMVFSLRPFPDVYQIWCQSVQPFDSLPRLFDLWPPKKPEMPLCVLRFNLFGIYPFQD